jgi:hypothetical protein
MLPQYPTLEQQNPLAQTPIFSPHLWPLETVGRDSIGVIGAILSSPQTLN